MMQERYVLICSVLHSIASAKADMINEVKRQRKRATSHPPFFVFLCISQLFPHALKYGKHSLLLQAETCGEAQDRQRYYQYQ